MTTAHEIIRDYWTACEARDWDSFGALLADDVVYDLPQTRQLIIGRERFVRFNAEYPGDWHLTVDRVVGEGDHAASLIHLTLAGEELTALSYFDFDERGLITRITEYWPEPYEPPTGREELTERY